MVQGNNENNDKGEEAVLFSLEAFLQSDQVL